MTKITGGNPHKSRMPILIESITGDKLIFKSKNQCAIYLNVNPAMVYFAVKKQNGIEYILKQKIIYLLLEMLQKRI